MDPKSSSIGTKQWVALVVAHELAHQWFGNIVTMEWWTHLWLNEGFASWMEYLATDAAFPEWQMWNQFVYSDMGRAFSLDSLKSSHPIEVPVSHPDEIDEIFDSISYSKGCSVIRMLYGYLGEEAFKKGLHQYLTKHSYANAFTEDLWEALEEASQKPVKQMMDTWTKQMGFPTVTVTPVPGSNPPRVKLDQLRFLASGAPEGEDAAPLWYIPVSMISDKSPDPQSELLQERSGEFEAPEGEWLKINAGQTGFFRVRYESEDHRNALEAAIRNGQLTNVIDRLGVQSDAMALASAGLAPTVDALKLITAYANETDYTVWADLTSNLKGLLDVLIQDDTCSGAIDRFGVQLYQKVGRQVGWDAQSGESPLVPQLRALVLRQLGRFGHPETVKESQLRFKAFLSDPSGLPADLRGAVYANVLQHGDEKAFEDILATMRASDFQEEKSRCMRSLGCTSTPSLLKRALELSLSSEIRPQDAVSLIRAVANNSKGRQLAWEFVQENWEKLHGMYKGGFLLNSLVKEVLSVFACEQRASEIEKFFEERQFTSRALHQALETIRTNAKWMNKDAEAVTEFFQKYSKI